MTQHVRYEAHNALVHCNRADSSTDTEGLRTALQNALTRCAKLEVSLAAERAKNAAVVTDSNTSPRAPVAAAPPVSASEQARVRYAEHVRNAWKQGKN